MEGVGTTESELFEAIQAGDEAVVRRLVSAEPGLAHARDASGANAVQAAVYRRNVLLAQLLWEHAHPGDLPTACAVDDLATARRHLADGADPNGLSGDGWTPLSLAAAFAHAELVRALIAAGAGLEALSPAMPGVRAVHAAAFGANAGAMSELLEAGANPDTVQVGGFTALHAAAQSGDVETVKVLLTYHAVRYVRCDLGKTPAELARNAGHDAVADLLA